ncbi:hypothetical protein ACFOOL_12910 [Devosia honganensis]|uniref:MarR family transcriptional regulator n=1 Tax=Devosia honganensis TaxID=1610527 RepID=A0ABV7X284_9HYPH
MRKLSPGERQFLAIIQLAGGSFCFSREDKVTAEAHRMLRRLDRAGLISVEPSDDGPLVTLTAQGYAEVDHG